MNPDCVFCKIIDGQLPCCEIYQDEHILAFLDIGPLSDGHTLIIPKKHVDRLEHCPPDVVAAMARQFGHIAKAVIDTVGAPDYNLLNNNGTDAGQVVDHLHFHIIPRSPGDGLFNRWPAGKYPPGRIEQLQQDIKKKL